MWRIHLYYLREVTASAALTFSVVFGIVLISVIYKALEYAAGLSLLAAAKQAILLAVDTLPHLMALSLLLATVLVYARASQDREITALRAAGVSPRIALAPALLVGILFSCAGSYALHYVVPVAHWYQFHGDAEIMREVLIHSGLRNGQFAPPKTGLTMTWDQKVNAGTFRDVLIRRTTDSDRSVDYGGLQVGLYAASEARLLTDSDEERLELYLQDLRALPSGTFLGELRLSVSVHEVAGRSRRNDVAKDMSSDHLLGEVAYGDSPELLEHEAHYTVNQRACFALMPVLFAPIGFCIGVLSRGRGRVLALSFALIPVALFYTADVVGKSLLRSTEAAWLGWLPALVVTALGIPFCWRLLRY
jgi:lipopolysaccharide export system permease protein